MTHEPALTEFPTRAEMAEHLAGMTADSLRRAIAEQGRAALALSGGSTPAGLYAALSKCDLDWSSVTAALVDERWTPPGEDGSNETFVRNTFQQNAAQDVRVLGLWSDAASPVAGLTTAQSRYGALKSPLDVVILGLGPDGHTASWFPHAEGLEHALRRDGPRLAAVTAKQSPVAGRHLKRMTMTLGAVRDARFICLMMTGAEKRGVFARALEDGPVEDMPVRAILRARPDLLAAWAP